jgi:phage terminase small subunit
MLTLKKIWLLVRQWWWLGLTLIVGLVCVLFFSNGNNRKAWNLLKDFNKKAIDHKQNYETLVKNVKEAQVKKDETIQELEETYNKKVEDIDKKSKKRLEEIIKESEEDPKQVAKDFAKEMGWEYVE